MARFSIRARRKRLLLTQARKNAGPWSSACWAFLYRVRCRKSILMMQEVDSGSRTAAGRLQVRRLATGSCASSSFSPVSARLPALDRSLHAATPRRREQGDACSHLSSPVLDSSRAGGRRGAPSQVERRADRHRIPRRDAACSRRWLSREGSRCAPNALCLAQPHTPSHLPLLRLPCRHRPRRRCPRRCRLLRALAPVPSPATARASASQPAASHGHASATLLDTHASATHAATAPPHRRADLPASRPPAQGRREALRGIEGRREAPRGTEGYRGAPRCCERGRARGAEGHRGAARGGEGRRGAPSRRRGARRGTQGRGGALRGGEGWPGVGRGLLGSRRRCRARP